MVTMRQHREDLDMLDLIDAELCKASLSPVDRAELTAMREVIMLRVVVFKYGFFGGGQW
jgi:hypothetical protein